MKAAFYMAVLSAVLAVACGKGELDTAELNTNPFDSDYQGPSVFVADSTYIIMVEINFVPTPFQAIAFHVREELFTAPSAYSVRALDRNNGVVYTLESNPSNTNRFVYIKGEIVPNSPVCLELRLFNNASYSRGDDICVTYTP